MSLEGIHDVYLAEGSVNADKFELFVLECLLPVLMAFNGINPRSIVLMDNASIHHADRIVDLIRTQTQALVLFLPPYSPDLNPVEQVFSEVKSIMKANDKLFQVYSAPRALLAIAFSMVTPQNCISYIRDCGYMN